VTKSGLNEELTLSIMACVALALRHVHSKGFLHLNIQPSSVYIMQSGVAKIGDFNCAQNINLTTTTTNPSSSSSDGGGGRASVSSRNSEASSIIIPKASLEGSIGISPHYLSPELASTVIAERAAATTIGSSSGSGGGGGGGGGSGGSGGSGGAAVEITSRRPLCPPGSISEKADVWALGILG
jgi:serine/threonine protein kinase